MDFVVETQTSASEIAKNTSAAKSFACNETSVTEYYTNLSQHSLSADRIYNFDKLRMSTVLATAKLLASRSKKQFELIVSEERGVSNCAVRIKKQRREDSRDNHVFILILIIT